MNVRDLLVRAGFLLAMRDCGSRGCQTFGKRKGFLPTKSKSPNKTRSACLCLLKLGLKVCDLILGLG